jgi:hypothetical protein
MVHSYYTDKTVNGHTVGEVAVLHGMDLENVHFLIGFLFPHTPLALIFNLRYINFTRLDPLLTLVKAEKDPAPTKQPSQDTIKRVR